MYEKKKDISKGYLIKTNIINDKIYQSLKIKKAHLLHISILIKIPVKKQAPKYLFLKLSEKISSLKPDQLTRCC